MNKEYIFNTTIEIAKRLKNENWDIEKIAFNEGPIIYISKFYAKVEIWFNFYEKEMSVSEVNHPNAHRFYQYINVDDVDVLYETIKKSINEFKHENFKLTIIDEYGLNDGHHSIREHFYPDDKNILYDLCDHCYKGDETLFSFSEYLVQYPNPAITLSIKKIDSLPKELANNMWDLKDSDMFFELIRTEYVCDNRGYDKKVTDEIKEQRTYYACINILSNKR